MKTMNKKVFALMTIFAALSACSNKRSNATLKADVLTLHDVVMNDDGRAENAKIALDSIDKKMPMPGDSAKILSGQLANLSDSMMDWMHRFDPDKQRSNDSATIYFNSQKRLLLKLDSSYQVLLKTSDNYLKKYHVKTGNKMQGMKM